MASTPPTSAPSLGLRILCRTHQAVAAVLILCGLGATVGWWLVHGGHQGRLIELEHAPPRAVLFQVDPNTADWPELVQLPGVGRTLADRIVAYRQGGGHFHTAEDMRRIKGIGPKSLEAIRPYLRLAPPESTAAADVAPGE